MALFDVFRRNGKQKPQQRNYAAASVGRLFSDFVGSERSADAELDGALVKIRSRTRELARNNEYARRYLDLLKTNVVGERGFSLQSKARGGDGRLDASGNAAVETAWRRWGELGSPTVDGRMSWIDAQRLTIEGLARDGEIFVVLHRGNQFRDSFAIEFIEPDQVDEQKTEDLPDGGSIRMGVEMDKFRRPVAYHVRTKHPGDTHLATSSYGETRRIPADEMVHVFVPLRAGQSRGEPWMTSALSSIRQLGALREAAIVNARVGASKMAFFTSPTGDGFVPDDLIDGVPAMSASPGEMMQLPAGVSVQTVDWAYPNNEFDGFHKACLKSIASGLGVSYTSLSNDLEATSYSSIRQGALEERDHYRMLQRFMLDHFVQPIFDAWLSASMELSAFGIPIRQYDRFREASTFRGRAWSWVDPQKEMNAALNGMRNGVLSLQDVAANYGKDVEELLSQIARDRDLMEQFGVQYALEPYGATQFPVDPEIHGDDG